MKITIDGVDLFEISEFQKKVLCNDIPLMMLEADLKRRIHYIVTHKYQQCLNRLCNEWRQKLVSEGIESLPASPEKLAEMVFARPDYRDRVARADDREKASFAQEARAADEAISKIMMR